MVALLLVRQEISVSGGEPSKQTFRVKNGPLTGGLPGNPPISDLLDFVNQVYTTSEGISSLADMAGSPLAVTPPLGLYITYSPNTNRPTPQGQFLADLISALAGGVKITFYFNTSNGTNGILFYMGDNLLQDLATKWIILTENGLLYDQGSLHIDNPVPDVGTHKVEIVLNQALGGGNYEYSVRYNDGSPLTQILSYPPGEEILYSQIGWSGFEADGNNLFQTYLTKITVEGFGESGPPTPGHFDPEFTVLSGNFLQVVDLIGPAPLPADSGMPGGPDGRRERAVGKLKEWD